MIAYRNRARGNGAVLPLGIFPLSVSSNSRHLQTATGVPFFLKGDTPWSIENQITVAQIDTYLANRAAKGFNAILFEAMEHLFSSQTPAYRNANGHDPFNPMTDFTSPVAAYWDHVEYVVTAAKALDIVCLITPAYAGFGGGTGAGAEGWRGEVDAETTADLQTYGQYVQNKLGVHGNVIWVMGGDWGADAAWNTRQYNIATGIRAVNPSVLITGHGARTEEAFPIWGGFTGFNLNNIYTNDLEYTFAATAYARSPVLPFFNIEGYYTGSGQTEADIRRQAYASWLSGACGHMLGEYPVWGFGEPNVNGGAGAAAAIANSLNLAGATQMVHFHALVDAYSWHLLEPKTDASLVTTALGTGKARVIPARATDGSFAMVWTNAVNFTVAMTALAPSSVRARWYNTIDGIYAAASGSPFANTGTQAFTAPGERVLVLDAA